jgi:hypothetical protein
MPARYAVGYYVHETAGHGYVVRERDAHAWCLVWNGKTWEDFDTTPASWVGKEGKRARAMQWFSDFWSWVGFQFAKFRWGQSNLRQYILWALVPVLALLLYQIIFRHRRRRRTHLPKPENPPPRFSGRGWTRNFISSKESWPNEVCRASPVNRFPTGWSAHWWTRR